MVIKKRKAKQAADDGTDEPRAETKGTVKKRKATQAVDDGTVEPSAETKGTLKKRKAKQPQPDKTETSAEVVPVGGGAEANGEVTFESLGVCEELCQACKRLNWHAPTKIQQEAIPWALQGRDVIGLAETGSGKTGAFALPIVQRLLDDPQRFYAVVLAPTRELCVQIGEHFEAVGSGIKLQTAVIVGGLDMVTQGMALAKRPHVVVASPGRLVDHLENTKGFHLRTIKYLVMDEADRLLGMDFDEALDKLLEVVPKQRNTFLFSATMTSKVSKLQRASLRRPVKVEVSTKHDTVKTLVQNYMFIPFKFKQTYLAALVSHYKHYAVMVFVDTCLNSQKLSVTLRHLGMHSISLHGQLNQAQRLGALGSFKAQECRILVATDVASRGLDIPSVDLVINFDIPKNSKDYIHRVGRTARAGRSGRAVTFVTQYDIELFQRIEHFLERKLDEFTELSETAVKASHERVLEAIRSTELELREKEDQAANKAVKRKISRMQSKTGKRRGGKSR